MEFIISKYNYWICIVLMMIGFYAMIAVPDLIKKIIGLNIFQTAIFLFYIIISARYDGTVPIIIANDVAGLFPDPVPYTNPLPHVLILTAIVVGVSVTAVALALVIRIYYAYDTIDEDEIVAIQKSDSFVPIESYKNIQKTGEI